MALTWIPWDVAAEAGAVVGAAGLATRASTRRWITSVGTFARELAIVLALYAMWRIVGTVSVVKVDGAISAGHGIWDAERMLRLPNERALQDLLLHSSLATQAANAYYASVHIPSMLVFLPWLWFCRRSVYPRVRNIIAMATLVCLAIQLIPVAPPRLVPDLRVADTPALFHQTVYPSFGKSGPAQLSAMPSVHIAWALIIGVTIALVVRNRWVRGVAIAHPIVTMLVVVATGNHYWLDGVAAAAVVGAMVVVESSLRDLFANSASRIRGAPSPIPNLNWNEASSD